MRMFLIVCTHTFVKSVWCTSAAMLLIKYAKRIPTTFLSPGWEKHNMSTRITRTKNGRIARTNESNMPSFLPPSPPPLPDMNCFNNFRLLRAVCIERENHHGMAGHGLMLPAACCCRCAAFRISPLRRGLSININLERISTINRMLYIQRWWEADDGIRRCGGGKTGSGEDECCTKNKYTYKCIVDACVFGFIIRHKVRTPQAKPAIVPGTENIYNTYGQLRSK